MATVLPYTYVDFDVLSEVWNEYELADGSKIRSKSVLVSVIKTAQYDAYGKPVYGISTMNILNVRAPKDLKGNPTVPPASPQELAMSVVEEVTFKPVRDTPNRYKLSDGTDLSVSVILTSVKRTDKYDALGEPIYMIDSQNVIKSDVPKALYRKPPTTTA